jgi:hypothetical protein
MTVIHLGSNIDKLWQDFLAKRALALASLKVEDGIAAGKAFGLFLATVGTASEVQLRSIMDREKGGVA